MPPSRKASSRIARRAELRVSPDNCGNVLNQQMLEQLLLFCALKCPLRNQGELTRAEVEPLSVDVVPEGQEGLIGSVVWRAAVPSDNKYAQVNATVATQHAMQVANLPRTS
jgi:hypothetical protein